MSQDPPARWRRLHRKTLVESRWITVHADRVRTGAGVELEPFFQVQEPDWVAVLGLDADGRLTLVDQYRYGADAHVLEFPAGDVDPDEDPEAAARRELREETGLTPVGAMTAIPPMHVEPARHTARAFAWVTQVAEHADGAAPEPSEDIRLVKLTPAEVEAAIASGHLCHATHIALFYRARALGLI